MQMTGFSYLSRQIVTDLLQIYSAYTSCQTNILPQYTTNAIAALTTHYHHTIIFITANHMNSEDSQHWITPINSKNQWTYQWMAVNAEAVNPKY